MRRPSFPAFRPTAGFSAARARARAAALALAAALAGGITPAAAQDTTTARPDPEPIARVPQGDDGWNGTRALELAARARERRREPVADSALRSYRADVTGHIYFFIDREDEPEPVLLRADQVALELYWGFPDRVKQVIRGMRSEKQFPIRDFRYYLDRYTVIQNGFEDVIRIGEGRDVRNVVHPLSADGAWFYQFRLADSTTIRLPGEAEAIRVYEIQVRPRDFGMPGIVGSLFVERARGDLVRLAFTFTPTSYRDRRNERVEIMLENALWEGRWWLPREQRLLVRREIPELDLNVGTVIRGALQVQDYDLNVDLPDGFFGGAEIVMAGGPESLARYDFDVGLYDGFEAVGLEDAQPGTLDAVDVDAIAGRIMRERFLRGVPRVRFFAPSGSDVLRASRTEGVVTGAGATLGVGGSQAYAYAGWAWGSGDPIARIGWRPAGPDAAPRLLAEAYLNRPHDLGLRQPTSGVVSSLSTVFLGRDYRDIIPTTGATAARRWGDSRAGRTTVSLTAEWFRQGDQAWTHAPGDEARRFRPVTPAADGSQIFVAVEQERRRPAGPVVLSLRPRVEAGFITSAAVGPADLDAGLNLHPGAFLRGRLDADARWVATPRTHGLDARLTAAAGTGEIGPHHLWYIGGPGTLPGHPFHAWAGSAAAVADVAVWRAVIPRWLRVRTFGAVGWSGGEELPAEVYGAGMGIEPGAGIGPGSLEAWAPGHTGGVKASVGLGLGLIDDLLRLDLAFPTDSWTGTLILSVDPGLWSFL